MNTQKGFSSVFGILLLVALGIGGVYFYKDKLISQSGNEVPPNDDNTVQATSTDNKESVVEMKPKIDLEVRACTECQIENHKIIQDQVSGFSITYPESWGNTSFNYSFNPGKPTYYEHKTYSDLLKFNLLFEPEVRIFFNGMNKATDIYTPSIYLVRKDAVADYDMAKFYKERMSKLQEQQDSGLLAKVRSEFNDCSQAEQFWYFGYCGEKFLNPVSIVNSGNVIVGFLPNQIGTSYDYGYAINGDEYYGLMLLEQNSESNFYKNNVFKNEPSWRGKTVAIHNFGLDGSVDVIDYGHMLLRFMETTDPTAKEDKSRFLNEIGPVVESIKLK